MGMTCMRGGLCPPSNFLRGDSVRGVFSGGILWGGGGIVSRGDYVCTPTSTCILNCCVHVETLLKAMW